MTPPVTEAPDTPHPLLRRGRKHLAVKLTDAELLRTGRELSQVMDDINEEEERQESIKKTLKARLAELGAKATQLATLLRRGEEMREVETETRADYADGVARETRLDTGEVIFVRPLDKKERQPPLPILDGTDGQEAPAP